MNFSRMLVLTRRRLKLSQTQLSAVSGVSQRQISFLESGRARPHRETIARLSTAMGLDSGAAAQFFESAGFVAPTEDLEWADQKFSSARQAIGLFLENQAPFPAYATDSAGEILASNFVFKKLIQMGVNDRTDLTALSRNIFDLTLSPNGIGRLLTNPAQVIPDVLRRLSATAECSVKAQGVLSRNWHHPLFKEFLPRSLESCSENGFFPEKYRLNNKVLAFTAMSARFGSPESAVAQAVQVEVFVPADAATRFWLESSH